MPKTKERPRNDIDADHVGQSRLTLYINFLRNVFNLRTISPVYLYRVSHVQVRTRSPNVGGSAATGAKEIEDNECAPY